MKMQTFKIITLLIVVLSSILASCKKEKEGIRDADDNLYHSVTIGTQTWLVENLRTTRFRNGDKIPMVTDNKQWDHLTSPAYCEFVNSSQYSSTYGYLYNSFCITDTRNICPEGYRIPTDEDWNILEIYLQNNGYNADGSVDTDNDYNTLDVTAKSLCDTVFWAPCNIALTVGNSDKPEYRNKSGFKALPGGARGLNGSFGYEGENAFFWSSKKNGDMYRIRLLHYNKSEMWHWSAYPEYGLSVRCIKE